MVMMIVNALRITVLIFFSIVVLDAAWDLIQERGLDYISHIVKTQQQQQQQRRSSKDKEMTAAGLNEKQSAFMQEEEGEEEENNSNDVAAVAQSINNMLQDETITSKLEDTPDTVR